MKKTLLYMLFAPLMLVLSACDDYLDIQPVGKVIPTTATEFRALMTEAYVTVPDDRGLASFRGDEMKLDVTNPMDIESYKDIWIWNDNAASENTSTFSWRNFYHVLFIANYVIESESTMTDGTPQEISQMVGEAYMLRAYMHFILSNLHAPAYTKCDPAVTKAVPLKVDSNVGSHPHARSMLSDIYAQILPTLTPHSSDSMSTPGTSGITIASTHSASTLSVRACISTWASGPRVSRLHAVCWP